MDLQTSSKRGSLFPNLHILTCVPPIRADSSCAIPITADIFSTTYGEADVSKNRLAYGNKYNRWKPYHGVQDTVNVLFVVAYEGVFVGQGEEVLRDLEQICRVGLERLDEP